VNGQRLRREERLLMPGTAPRLRGIHHDRAYRETSTGEWDCGVLEEQLCAFERDIQAARRRPSYDGAVAASTPRVERLRGELVRLRGGEAIFIRPIEPGDIAQLRHLFHQLSALSRLRRFLTPVASLTRHQLAYLTAVDHRRHEALVALDARTGEGVGVARYVRAAEDPGTADVAVVVVDRWHGRGVGSALLIRLGQRASESGLCRLTSTVLAGNDAARRLLRRLPAVVHEERVGGATRVSVDLAQRPS
jgi:acetyltransferase